VGGWRRVPPQLIDGNGDKIMGDHAPASLEESIGNKRLFLLVVDASDELRAAVRFACRRALHTNGAVALFYAVEPSEFHHFATIAELMEEEAHTEAQRLLQTVAADVHNLTGAFPSLHMREGDTTEQLLQVLLEEPDISVLVLGASASGEGPGPLVSALSDKLAGKINVPVTVVPGGLSNEEIDTLT